MDRLKGRVAIVTGGARGIGGAIAKRFVDEGAQVVISDILVTDGEALARELGDAAIFVRADVKSAADWAMLVKATVDHFGGLDILVNNAGGRRGSAIWSMRPRIFTATSSISTSPALGRASRPLSLR